MIHAITQEELETDPFLHGALYGLRRALNRYVELAALDDKISERVMTRIVIGALRDIQIISTDDRIVVQLAID